MIRSIHQSPLLIISIMFLLHADVLQNQCRNQQKNLTCFSQQVINNKLHSKHEFHFQC